MTPTPVTLSRTVQKVTSNVTASQIDTARTTRAKLDSMKPVQYVGIFLVLGCVACFYPPVFAAVRSRTLQLAAGVAGLVLILLPSIIVDNERLLLWIGVGVAVAFVGWYAIHRNALKQGFIDANNDGIDDRLQNGKPASTK